MNQRELRLALLLVAMIVGAGGWVVFRQMAKWKADIERREHDLALRRVEANELMRQKDFWKARSEWLETKQPAYPGRTEADTNLYNSVEESARTAGVTLLGRQLQQPEQLPGTVGVGLMVEAKGSLDKLLHWLHALQNPEAFVSVRGMVLKPDPEDTSIVLLSNLHVQKWYRLPLDAPPIKTTAAR